ncbi:MAG: energy-coupling factor transporter transmembrane protein EcfT [Coriobacteriia bacterium]|nr:energy-coupling factor transporter transmembrane protein EcfT [Coriobacteriia bacterium]
MAVPVPFGQFVPGDSAVHRLDPRVKLGLTAAYSIALFAFDGWKGFVVAAVLVVLAVGLSRVPLRLALRGLRAVSLLLAFTLVANAVRWQPVEAALRLGPLGISLDGLMTGAFFVVRIVLLVVGTSLLTLTTSPVALTDALSRVMRPLRIVRVPVDDVATMFSIALRFIPTTAEEAEKIVVAQSARGAVFDEGGPVRRAKAWVPVLVPLFVSLFRRADRLAVAMESRCYTGAGRTRLHEPVMRGTDWLVLATGVTVATMTAILF